MSGPVHRGYHTREEAENAYARAWVDGRLQVVEGHNNVLPYLPEDRVAVPTEEMVIRAMATRPVSIGPYYAVFRGRVPGVYDSW